MQEPSLFGFALFALMVVSCPSSSPRRNFRLQVACGRRLVSGQPRCSRSLRQRPTPASALCTSFSTALCRSCGCYRSCDWGTVVCAATAMLNGRRRRTRSRRQCSSSRHHRQCSSRQCSHRHSRSGLSTCGKGFSAGRGRRLF